MTLILSPFAQEVEKDVEDAILLGKEAREKAIETVYAWHSCEEISHEERDHFLAALRNGPPPLSSL
jgi:hypothetical protein